MTNPKTEAIDVRAAAERLRTGDYYQKPGSLPDVVTRFDDERTLALAYLALTSPDDAEALTEEWLRGVGGEIQKYDGAHIKGVEIWDAMFKSDKIILRVQNNGTAILAYYDDLRGFYWPVQLKTRGEVRLLCRALGIELKQTN